MHLNLLYKLLQGAMSLTNGDSVGRYGSSQGRGKPHRTISKTILLAMKITTILLIAACLQVSAVGFSQKINLSVKNASLKTVFLELNAQTGFNFLYSDEALTKTNLVSLNVKNADIEKVLELCLKNQPLHFSIVNKTIVIKQKENVAPIPAFPIVTPSPPITITGRITNAKNEPLIGVTVMIKGTTKRSLTDDNGYYKVQIDANDKTLVFSCIGMKRQEIIINGRIVINVVMKEELSNISEVVVTGLFSRPKESYTGAARTFNQQEILKVSNGNLFDALKSLDPSLQVPQDLSQGSNPNVLPQVVLRGGNNIVNPNSSTTSNVYGYANSPNAPLFILDGFEVNAQRVFDLETSRILSVVILKDATATSIYGSRAANGVIVIESVPPAAGKLRVSYSGSMVVEAPDLKGYNLLKAQDKLDLEKALIPVWQGDGFFKERRALINNFRQGEISRGIETDWMHQPLQNAFGEKHTLYAEGGDKTITYAMTGTIDKRNGVMKGSGRDNTSLGTLLSYRTRNFLFKNELTLNFNKAKNSPYGSFSDYVKMNPYWAPRDANGNIPYYLEFIRDWTGTIISQQTNPLYNSTLNIVDESKYQNFIENFYAQWTPTNWLKATARLSYQKQQNESDKFLPAQHTSFAGISADKFYEKGSYTKTYGRNSVLEATMSLDVNKSFGKSVLYSSLGSTFQENSSSTEAYTIIGFPNDRLSDLLMGNRYPDGAKPTGVESHKRLAGYYANASYTYNSRYLLDASYRLDGSSLFGSDRRFASFWSVGTGWNIHKESFFKDIKNINRLKLRYSLGYTGSQNFDSYLGITTSQYFTSSDYRYNLGTYLMGYGNTSLQWQKTLKHNIGIDITAFNQYFDASFNYFNETSQGSVTSISTAPSTGFLSYQANLGDVSNKGWELNTKLMLYNNPVTRENFSLFFNAFHVVGKIEKISNQLDQLNKKNATTLSTSPLPRYVSGQSITAIWAVPSLGIDPATGQEIYKKRDGTTTTVYDPADQVVIADSRPKIESTFGLNMEIKGVGANIYFRYRYGGYTYNQTLVDRVELADVAYNVDSRVYENSWLKPGDITFFKGKVLSDGSKNSQITYASSRFVQKDNMLSLENVSFYYRFSDKFNKDFHVQNTRVTLYLGEIFWVSSIKRERGLTYPFSHSVTLQLTTTF